MLLTVLFALALHLPQDPHKAMNDRGAHAMGFDQDKTAHHFLLYNDGGAMEIGVKDSSDATNRDSIRGHLPHISVMFSDGNFDVPMLVHDTKSVPGIVTLAARRKMITYRYVETPTGGRVEMVTKDAEALKALHAFLRYQIKEHQTGDPGTVALRR